MKILLRILSNWCERYLQISMINRSISRAKKQQNDIDFASVCCFKLLEFELFEFLLIDAFWLIADSETENRLTKRWLFWRRANDCEKNELFWLNNKSIDSCFSILRAIAFVSLVCKKFIFIDVDCEDVKNRKKQRMRFWWSL